MKKCVVTIFLSLIQFATSVFASVGTKDYSTMASLFQELYMGTVSYSEMGYERVDTVLVEYFSMPPSRSIIFMNKSFNPFNSLTKIENLDTCITVNLAPIDAYDAIRDLHWRYEIRKSNDFSTCVIKNSLYDKNSGAVHETDSMIISYQPESMMPYYNYCVKWNFLINKNTLDNPSSLLDEMKYVLDLLEKHYTNFNYSITLIDEERPIREMPIEFSNIEEIWLYQKRIKIIPY